MEAFLNNKFNKKWQNKLKKKTCPKRFASLAGALSLGAKNGKKCGQK
jgi:hypothetical protein